LQISPSKHGRMNPWRRCDERPTGTLPDAAADAVVSEWFSTGDIGQVDEDGSYIVARKKI
jgi:acyl-CoA synthetase (AMP-forming)/AMP-acid ligase II